MATYTYGQSAHVLTLSVDAVDVALQEQRVKTAREHLIYDARWYGVAAMRLESIADPSVKTAQTDGTVMRWSPAYVATLTPRQLKTVWAHEAMHCTLRHLWRLKGKDLLTANQAADYVVNHILDQDKSMELPPGALLDPQYGDDWDFERVYAHIRHNQQPPTQPGKPQSPPQPPQPPQGPGGTPQPQQGAGDENGPAGDAPGGMGDFTQPATADAAKGTGDVLSEGDWALYSEQVEAMMTKAGRMPAGVSRALKAAKQPPQDWKELLADYVAKSIPTDTSWARPSRRYYAAMGAYMPGQVKENVGPLVVVIDTSGSVSPAMLSAMAVEVESIARDAQPEYVQVVYHDTRVYEGERFEQDDTVKLRARGGGGTLAQPVVDYLNGLDEQPVCVVWMTDLEFGDRPSVPDAPVIFATPGHSRVPAPFGEVVRVTV